MELNVKHLRQKAGLSQAELAEKTGIPKGRINGWEQKGTKPKAEDRTILERFFEEFENKDSRLPAKYEEHLIPFYETMAIGGKNIVTDDSAVMANQYELIRPGHFFGKATGALRLYGDSMYEKYPSGSIIAFKDADHWREFIHFGQDYVIETADGARVVKTVMAAESVDDILAVSHNTFKNKHGIDIFRPYVIPKKLIRRMAYVLGIIKFEASI